MIIRIHKAALFFCQRMIQVFRIPAPYTCNNNSINNNAISKAPFEFLFNSELFPYMQSVCRFIYTTSAQPLLISTLFNSIVQFASPSPPSARFNLISSFRFPPVCTSLLLYAILCQFRCNQNRRTRLRFDLLPVDLKRRAECIFEHLSECVNHEIQG